MMVRQLLSMNTTPLRLNMNVKLGEFDMKSPKASWEVRNKKPELKVQSDPIKVKIDRRETYASMGIYMPDLFRRKTEQESKQIALETIGEIGEDWRTITESQGRAFFDVCLKNARFYNTVELVQNWIPSVKPNITWEGGRPTRVSFTPHKIDVRWETHERPQIRYNKGKNEVSVKQWHKVNVEYLGNTSDVIKLGTETAKKLNIKV